MAMASSARVQTSAPVMVVFGEGVGGVNRPGAAVPVFAAVCARGAGLEGFAADPFHYNNGAGLDLGIVASPYFRPLADFLLEDSHVVGGEPPFECGPEGIRDVVACDKTVKFAIPGVERA